MSTPAYADFIVQYPEFEDISVYSQSSVEQWLSNSINLVNVDVWGSIYNHGVYLLTAHNLVMFNNMTALKQGTQGLLTSKSVKGVSASIDYSLTTIATAGLYNKTIYGQMYYQLQSQFAGCVQI